MIVHTAHFTTLGRVHVIDGFFEVNLANELLHWFIQHNQEPTVWTESDKFKHRAGRLVYQGQHKLIDRVQEYASSAATINQITQLIDRPVRLSDISAWIDLPGYEISPHTDFMDDTFQFYGLQIYFAQQINFTQGTCFYHQHDPVFNLPLRQNFGYLVDRGDQITHGLAHAVPTGLERYSLHLKYSST